MFIPIELQSYGRYILAILHRNSELSTIVELHYFSDPFLLAAMVPIKIYSNAEADKEKILKENTNKSGIYMWKNSTNGKRYIGSSMDLYFRLSFYCSTKAMETALKNSKSYIYNALLKYGHSNFSLTILEYCESEKCIEREGYYLKTYNPEYNIAMEPGASFSGRKHSEETKKTISDAIKGSNHSDETKTKISDAMKGKNHPNYGKNRSDETKTKISDTKKRAGLPRAEGAGMPSTFFFFNSLNKKKTQ
jgi:group I intron endonuclease